MEPPSDIKRNQRFSDQELETHANKMSSDEEIIQGSDSTPLTKVLRLFVQLEEINSIV